MKWTELRVPLQMFNLTVRIDIHSPIDEELFLKAFRLTVERLPYCRLRLHRESEEKVVQYISEMDEQKLCDLQDFSGKSEKQAARQMKKWAGTPFANKLMDSQLYEAHLLRRNDGTHTLYFCAAHMIMDVYAECYVAMYLDMVYDALVNGAELPREGGDPEELVRRTLEYEASDRRKEDDRYWEAYNKAPAHFTTIDGVNSPAMVKGQLYGKDRKLYQSLSRRIKLPIPSALTERIKEQALQNRVSPYIYFVLAMQVYLSRVCQTKDASIFSVVVNRATLLEKTGGLSFAGGFIFPSCFTGEEKFRDAVLDVNHRHMDGLRHIGSTKSLDLLIDGRKGDLPKGMTYVSAYISYIPFLDFSKVHLDVTASKIEPGIAMDSLYLLLIPTDASGDLLADYQYALFYVKRRSVEKYHDFMLRFLEAGIERPDATIRELTDLAMKNPTKREK